MTAEAATVVVGVFGTMISPYLFFWQASEEVEEMQRRSGELSLVQDGRSSVQELDSIGWDTWSGMFYSDLTALFIITTAVTLNAPGITDIETAAQAASALRPLAGEFALVLFALGILGVGLIGVPVLAGSAPSAMCEARDGNGDSSARRPTPADSMASSLSACSPASGSSFRRSTR